LPVEAFGDSKDFEAGDADAPHLRLGGTGRHRVPLERLSTISQGLWMFVSPATSVTAVDRTVEEH